MLKITVNLTLLFNSLPFIVGTIGIYSPHLALADDLEIQSFQLETFDQLSRIKLSIDESVSYELKTSSTGFSLLLRGFALIDLGIPLGDEERWIAHLSQIKDSRVGGFSFKETAQGLLIEGKWKISGGAEKLAHSKMESFDYRERNPARLMIDFWVKESLTSRERQDHEQREAEAKQRRDRKLEQDRKKAEADDLRKFCRRPLNDQQDIFLPFSPLHESFAYDYWVNLTLPDHGFVYFEPKGKNPDAQYLRLALDLYRKGKLALTLRTIEFFEAEHPLSSYRAEMKFLRANALMRLGKANEAEQVLHRLLVEEPDASVTLQATLYLAAKKAKEKLYLSSLESFLWLIERYPHHRLVWMFHLGAAESLYGLKHTEKAAKEFKWVMDHSEEMYPRLEAASRLGDVYLDKLQYENALAEYSLALTLYPKEMERFPSIHLNRAETLYWLGQYDEAKKAFLGFIEKFGYHTASWRVTYRLGEIEARQGDGHAREWFSDTINRFPTSPGVLLARLHLLPCGDHGGFNAELGLRFLDQDAVKFTGNSEVLMNRYPEWLTLTKIRSLIGWSREKEAYDVALREMSLVKNRSIRLELFKMQEVLFRQQIHFLIDEGKLAEAIAFYQGQSVNLPKELRNQYPDYLLSLSDAAANLSLTRLSEEFQKNYREALGEDRGRVLASGTRAPDPLEELEERLKKSEVLFAEAKSVWVSGRAVPGAIEAERVRTLLAQVSDESPFSYQREIILGLLEEKSGKSGDAQTHVAQAETLRPSAFSNELRLKSWLIRLKMKLGDLNSAFDLCTFFRGANQTEEIRFS